MSTPSEFQPLASKNPIFNAERGIAYPSPFFDVASTYIPRSVKSLYRWCDFYFRTNPLINAICTKLSEYPITDVVIESPNDDIRLKWEDYLFDRLQYKSFEIGAALDYHVFGACIITFSFPFRKLLTCMHCNHEVDAETNKKWWRYAVDRFLLKCPKCGQSGKARARDRYVGAVEGIRLMRRNPIDIDVHYHEESGKVDYVYNPPPDLRADIVSGKKHVVANCAQELLEAVRLGRSIRLNPENLFYLKRTTCSTREQGLGSPVILPVLKDVFYLQILKKAQEALSLGTIIPLRIFFPQAGGPMQDPVMNVNLSEWRNMLELELRKFRYDPLYTPILPFPVGHQMVGGEGRALLLSQEIRVMSEQIIVGMGYPPSLVFGDVAWSGSSIALRMLENSFLRFIEQRKLLLKWVCKTSAKYLHWEIPDWHVKPFKMADDIQRQSMSMNLNQMGAISRETMLAGMDYNPAREQELVAQERKENLTTMAEQGKASARVQGETMLVQAEYQAKAQMIQGQVQQALGVGSQVRIPGAVGGPQGIEAPSPKNPYTGALQGLDARVVPRKLAEQISAMPQEQKSMALTQLQASQPELYAQVMKTLVPAPSGSAPGARAMPEQRPPRAGPNTAMI